MNSDDAQQAFLEGERARRYWDSVGVIIVAIDSARRVMWINRRGCEILGRPEQEIVGLDWFDNFIPADLRFNSRKIFDQLIAGRTEVVPYFENPLMTAGGECWLAWHHQAILDERGRIEGTLSTGLEIGDKRRAEQALEEEAIECTANLQRIQNELQAERDQLQREKERAELYLNVARVALLALDCEGAMSHRLLAFGSGSSLSTRPSLPRQQLC